MAEKEENKNMAQKNLLLLKHKKADRIFNDQLARTGAGYFDYYLLHSVEDGANYEGYVKYDCFNWAKKKKEEGLIKHFGFSFHGTPELLDKILSEHPEVEIVQIQMNYADWDNPLIQSGRLYEVLRKYNMPFLVMEPVKGGSLASAGKEIEAEMKRVHPDASIASWALRFAASLHRAFRRRRPQYSLFVFPR